MTVLWMGLAVLAAAVPLTWLIDRKCAQYEREAKMRRLLAPHVRALKAFKVAVGVALIPVMQKAVRAAAEMEAAMKKLNDDMQATKGTNLADLARLADQMKNGAKR